jgi:predicted ArsR family transcriptional regulator
MAGQEGGLNERAERDIQRLADALGDPTRRRVFFAVRAAEAAQTKDQVAEAVGIERRLAGFHLDKLVEHGFLDADFRRPAGRTGPGAGRPPKRYTLASAGLSVSLPERHYDLLASLLLRVLRDGQAGSGLDRVGFEFGRELGLAELARRQDAGVEEPAADADVDVTAAAVGEVVRMLSRYGFAARSDGPAAFTACSCPFEEVAFDDPGRICALDRAIWRGLLSVFSPGARLSATTTRALGDEACRAEVVAPSG